MGVLSIDADTRGRFMLERFLFYFQYGAKNLWRNRRWSAFAMLSVAAGVATVVALRGLGLAIEDSLTGNVRQANHGDILIERGGGGLGFADIDAGRPDDDSTFLTGELARLQQWADENDARISPFLSTGVQVTAMDGQTVGRLQLSKSLFIDPATYPAFGEVLAIEPEGVPVGELFEGGREVVISDNLAEQQGIEVGETVRVSGTDDLFVVRGIVPTGAEAGLRDLFAAFFGFAYFNLNDTALLDELNLNGQPNRISVALPGEPSGDEVLDAANRIEGLFVSRGWLSLYTVPRILEQNQIIAETISTFAVTMGLGAMLLGGVGIINTMLVMVRRRTIEIAALKTFGLKGRQIAYLFMAEAFILGVLGSITGAITGTLLTGLVSGYGETVIQQTVGWRLYPEAVGYGFVLGLVVTVVFGVLPVLTATKVRPSTILRPNETVIPRAGILQSFLAIGVVVVALGLITAQILSEFPAFVMLETDALTLVQYGLIGVAGTLFLLAVLVGLFWIIVWIVSRVPTFGWVEMRLALRNMTTRRTRTATTLLALTAGMFALSSIAFVGEGVREILRVTLSDTFGGNVFVISLVGDVAQPVIDDKIEAMSDKIDYSTRWYQTTASILAVDGQPVGEELRWVEMSTQVTGNPDATTQEMIAGRPITPADEGQPVVVVRQDEYWRDAYGIEPGVILTVENRGERHDVEVVGIAANTEETNLQGTLQERLHVPPGVFSLDRYNVALPFTALQVPEEYKNEVMTEIAAPLIFVLDITFIDSFLSNLIEQFSALPVLVGMLSLAAAAVIMANTVALSTLERRRQIGILKAVGLKGKRVLRIMLLENVLISLLGGIIGIGLSGLGVYIMTSVGLLDAIIIPDDATPVAIGLVVAAVAIGGVATFLSARVAVRERVLNVLRYE